MLSESQERMLIVAKPGMEKDIEAICNKWDVHAATIGRVTNGNALRVRMNGKTVAEIPADSLVVGGGAPVYIRETKEPEYLKATRAFDTATLPKIDNLKEALLKLLAAPNIASKQWVYQQYDHTVRSNTVIGPGSDAAVLRIKGTGKGLALKTDCNGRYVYLNPRRGAMIAVAEAARNVVVSGARPVAITNCLNFGNPYKPEIYWQFKEAIAGISEACRVLETPVTGGNVSFYNESPDRAVYPTPTIGMLGILDDIRHATTAFFKNEGDEIALLGANLEEIGGSEFLKIVHGQVAGDCPFIDLQDEKSIQAACLEAIQTGLLNSAHDVSDGGLGVALAECCIMNHEHPIGATFELWPYDRADFAFFGESQSMIIISYAPMLRGAVAQICQKHDVPFTVLGRTGGTMLKIPDLLEISLAEMAERYYFSIETMLEKWT
jgi:phosphoribosylformylglycinamidine synthase